MGIILLVILSIVKIMLISALFNRINRYYELHMGVYHSIPTEKLQDELERPMDGEDEDLHDSYTKMQERRDTEFDERIAELQKELDSYPQMQKGYPIQQRTGNIANTEEGVYNLPHKDIPIDVSDAPEISN